MPSIPTASWLDIPPWLDEVVPGAAIAARMIGNINNDPNLSEPQRARLQRLVSEKTKSAWNELPIRRHKSKRQLGPLDLHAAQHELLVTAFYAADFEPIGQSEIERSKQRLANIGKAAGKLSREIGNTGNDASLTGRWLLYRYRHSEVLQPLPDNLPSVAKVVNLLGDFFAEVAPHYKISPVTPVGHPRDDDAPQTTVLLEIAKVIKKHFGTPLYGTVATLASVSLNEEISTETARSSLRGKTLA